MIKTFEEIFFELKFNAEYAVSVLVSAFDASMHSLLL